MTQSQTIHVHVKEESDNLYEYVELATIPNNKMFCLNILTKDYFKVGSFVQELSYIDSLDIRAIAVFLLCYLPDYFFTVSASSTGKYHPAYTVGNGGLVRHTKAAVRIAIQLLRLEMYSHLLPMKDYIIAALLIHDGWKHGKPKEDGTYEQYSNQAHSKICSDRLRELAESIPQCKGILLELAYLVLTHMGQWNTNSHTGEIFAPKPATQEQCFVHLCDYLASRKCLEFNFDTPIGEL